MQLANIRTILIFTINQTILLYNIENWIKGNSGSFLWGSKNKLTVVNQHRNLFGTPSP